MPPLTVGQAHVSRHIIRPGDIDVFMELNNGRTLTLYDIGRMALFVRLGILPIMKENGWVGTVAGSSVRYRRRVRMFDRVTMRSRITGWDARFIYAEHSMWRSGECTSHGLIRMAVTGRNGLVPTAELAQVMDVPAEGPPLPPWIQAWADAEAQRPWPPMDETAPLG